jgi:hypothetical protein
LPLTFRLTTGNEPWNGNNWQQQQHHHQQPWNNRPGYWSHNKNEGGRFPPPNAPTYDYNRGDYFMCGVAGTFRLALIFYANSANNTTFYSGFGGPPPPFEGIPTGPPPQMPPYARPRHQWEGKNMKIDRRFQNSAHNAPPIVEQDAAPVLGEPQISQYFLYFTFPFYSNKMLICVF